MYTNNVFNKIKKHISDEEVISEIHEKFHTFNKNLIFNSVSEGAVTIAKNGSSFEGHIATLPNDQDTFEAIVLAFGRPALLVQNGIFEEPVLEIWKNRLTPHKEKLKKAISAVGRIEIKNHPSITGIGTGWITEGNILVTNRHVAQYFCTKKGRSFVFLPNHFGEKMEVCIDFKEEYQNDDELEINITDVLYIAPYNAPDLALLKIDSDVEGILIQEGIEDNSIIATIGYPARDDRNGLGDQVSIFKDIFNVKRFQPGIKTAQLNERMFVHDCSTLGGNSGSPIIDVKTGRAAGLHFGGKYLKTNYAVDGRHLIEVLHKINN